MPILGIFKLNFVQMQIQANQYAALEVNPYAGE